MNHSIHAPGGPSTAAIESSKGRRTLLDEVSEELARNIRFARAAKVIRHVWHGLIPSVAAFCVLFCSACSETPSGVQSHPVGCSEKAVLLRVGDIVRCDPAQVMQTISTSQGPLVSCLCFENLRSSDIDAGAGQ